MWDECTCLYLACVLYLSNLFWMHVACISHAFWMYVTISINAQDIALVSHFVRIYEQFAGGNISFSLVGFTFCGLEHLFKASQRRPWSYNAGGVCECVLHHLVPSLRLQLVNRLAMRLLTSYCDKYDSIAIHPSKQVQPFMNGKGRGGEVRIHEPATNKGRNNPELP